MIRKAARHLLYRASQNRRLISSKDFQRYLSVGVDICARGEGGWVQCTGRQRVGALSLLKWWIHTRLYLDLLACSGTEAEAFITREIIDKTLEDAGITKSPTKGQWTSSQVVQDHLGNNIDSKGAGSLQLPERRYAVL